MYYYFLIYHCHFIKDCSLIGLNSNIVNLCFKSIDRAVVSGGTRGALAPRNLLTLFQPDGADYAHYNTASTPAFENLMTSL